MPCNMASDRWYVPSSLFCFYWCIVLSDVFPMLLANTALQVVGTACGDRSDEIHNGNLYDLNAKYADVVSEEDAILHLLQKW